MRIRATDELGPKPITILELVVGSTAHGIAVQDGLEDLDLMAVVLDAAPRVLGFAPRDTWVNALVVRLDAAHARSTLPEHPDEAMVGRWMIETYLAHWSGGQRVPQGKPGKPAL